MSVTDPEGAVNGAKVTLWFENVGDGPPNAVRDTIYVFEDVPTVIPISALLGNDTDIDRDPLRFVSWRYANFFDAFRFPGAGPVNGTIEYDQDGNLLFTPFANADASGGFIYRVTDDADGSSEGFVEIAMIPSNDDPTAQLDEGFITPLDVPLVIRVSDLLANDYDIEQADTDGDGTIDVDMDDPNRPRPTFVGIDAVLDPAQLALGNRVQVGTAEIVTFRGEQFVVVRFPQGFTGPVTIEYRIADTEGLQDTGFALAAVSSFYSGTLLGTPRTDLIEGAALVGNTIQGFASDDYIIGGDTDDRIDAGSGDDKIETGGGNDLILGGAGADVIDGGAGFDTVDFSTSTTGLRADLESRVGQGGDAQGDVYIGIEALVGTSTTTTSAATAANTLDGQGGADEIVRSRRRRRALWRRRQRPHRGRGRGRPDRRRRRQRHGQLRVRQRRREHLARRRHGQRRRRPGRPTHLGIENLIGTDVADRLEGNDKANLLKGGRGDDVLIGGAGDDILIGGRGADTLVGGEGVDTVSYIGSDGPVTIDLANSIAGSAEAQGDDPERHRDRRRLERQRHDPRRRRRQPPARCLGADVIDGRGGFDIADYSTSDVGVSVDLGAGVGTAGDALGDTLIDIEMLLGSNWVDTLRGSAADETFDGGYSNDLVYGGAGSDRYLFGFDSGEDVITELGNASDIDRLVMKPGIAPKDFSLLREGDDLLVELERDDGILIDTVRFKDHFLGTETGIEEIVFANGVTWDRAKILDLIRLGRFNAADDLYRFGTEDQVAILDPAQLVLNDVTADWDQLTLVSVQNALFGTVSITADGKIAFLGDHDYNGDAWFDYTVRDQYGRKSTATVEVDLSPVNDAPVAVDDGPFGGIEDVPLRIRIENLLVNDYDVDGDADLEELRIVDVQPLVGIDGNRLDPYRDPDYQGEGTNVAWKFDGAYLELKPRPDYFGFAGFIYTLMDASGATSTGRVELYFDPVNDAPRLHDQRRVIRLEQTTTITVAELMAGTYDVEGDAITFVGLHYPANANPAVNGHVVFDQAAGTIAFTPDALGNAGLLFDTIDARGATSTLTYNIFVRPLNDAPIARNDYGFRTLEDQILVINPAQLLANDTDENGDTLILTGVEPFPDNGKVRIRDDGLIEFRPRSDYNGNAGFIYYISDGRGGFDEAYVSITVLPRNDGPVLRDDVAYGLEDVGLFVIPAEVFGNDYDLQGDVIFFKKVTLLGTLDKQYLGENYSVTALSGNNTALPGWLTFDATTMTFRGIMPAGQTEPVDVAIFLHDPSNNSTRAFRYSFTQQDAANLAQGISEQQSVLGGYIVRHAFESGNEFTSKPLASGTVVTATLADGTALPNWLSFNAATLAFTGTAPEGVTGAIDVALNFARGGNVFTDHMTFDAAAPAAGVRYDSDVALFDISHGHFTAGLFNGRELPDWLEFDASTMTFSLSGFAPDADAPLARVRVTFHGDPRQLPDKTYASSDGDFALEFLIDPDNIQLDAINALLQNNAYFAAQGLFAVDLSAAAAINARQETNAPLPSWLTFNAEQLTFSGMPPATYIGALPVRLDVTGAGGLPTFSLITDVVVDDTFTVADPQGGFGATIVGGDHLNLLAPQNFDGSIVYSYTATDEKGGVSTDPAILVFDVLPAAEKPVAGKDQVNTFEDQPVIFTAADLLKNDRDDDGDALRVTAITQPTNGTLTVNLATVLIDAPATLAQAPGASWSVTLAGGAALPSWMTVNSATGRVTATVPLDLLASYNLVFSRTLGGTTTSDTLTRAFNGNVGATFTYTPNDGYAGNDALTYTVTDDHQGSSTGQVSVKVNSLFDPPTTVADLVNGIEDTPLTILPATLLANDFDVDGNTIRFLGVLNPEYGSVSFDGTAITFIPDYNFSGDAHFEYLVTDDTHGSSVGEVTVRVASTNRAPVAVADVYTIPEDTPFVISRAGLIANDTDADGDPLRFVSITRTSNGGRLVEMPDGQFQFVPNENFYGQTSFTYSVTDGRLTRTGSVTFDVQPVNDAPIANTDGIYIGEKNTPLVINLSDLLLNDRDVEGDSFTLVEVFDGDNGDVVQVGDTAVFTARQDYVGNAGFHYRVTDSHGADSIGFVSLTIRPNVPLPIAVSDAGFELLEDTYFDIDPAVLMANDYAPEGSTLTFLGVNGAGVTQLENGLYRFTPDHDFFGTVTLTYAITNENGFPIPTTITLEVLRVEDAPVAVADQLTLTEDQTLTIFASDLMVNDYDVDNQALIFSRVVGGTGVSAVYNPNGQLTITPDADFSGTATLDYEIEDSTGRTSIATVTIDVTAVNDAPVISAVPVVRGTEDRAFSAVLPADLVSDADHDAVLIELRSPGGGALPSWLSYDTATRTLSGQPPANFNGEILLEIAAEDQQTRTVRQLVVAIAPANDLPALITPYADVSVAEDMAVDIAIPANAFSDIDGDPLALRWRSPTARRCRPG